MAENTTTTLAAVEFHGATLVTTLVDGVPHVALKPLCEAIGLDWDAQRKRVMRDPVLSSVAVMTTATGGDGKRPHQSEGTPTMNTVINAPTWACHRPRPGTIAADLRQLVNVAGPLASGMAVALEMIQHAEVAEEEGSAPAISRDQRGCLLSLCLVSAQLLAEAAGEACNTLMERGPETH